MLKPIHLKQTKDVKYPIKFIQNSMKLIWKITTDSLIIVCNYDITSVNLLDSMTYLFYCPYVSFKNCY